jgi:hypothetical protein
MVPKISGGCCTRTGTLKIGKKKAPGKKVYRVYGEGEIPLPKR